MSESAVALAADLTNNEIRRSVSVEITNLTNGYCLINPNGNCQIPPQPTVRPHKTEVCSFSRNDGFCGAVGVLTYDLFKGKCHSTKEKVAIMFSVPFDYIEHENWVAIGIYADDKELYKEMYYNHEKSDSEKHGFVRKEAKDCGLTFEGSSLEIKATMTPVGESILKVEVWDKPGESPEQLFPIISDLEICRSVDLEITNLTDVYCLINPNGNCQIPPQLTVRSQKSELCKFSKVTGSVWGAVGVLTYDLFKGKCHCTKEKLAIMFSGLFDYIQNKNWVAIGIYADDKECDDSLYKEMYYDDQKSDSEKHGFVRKTAKDGGLTFEGSTMSPVGGSVLKVEVWDKPRDE